MAITPYKGKKLPELSLIHIKKSELGFFIADFPWCFKAVVKKNTEKNKKFTGEIE